MLLKIAFRNLFRQKRRTILTLLTMIVGFVLSSIAISVSDGGYGNLIQLFTKTQTGHIQIHNSEYRDKPSLYKTVNNIDEIANILKKTKGIKSFSGRVLSAGLTFYDKKTYGVKLIGINTDFEKETTGLNNRVTKGEYLKETEDNDILISYKLAENLNANINDMIALVSQGADGSTSNDLFKIKGIFGNEKDNMDTNNIYMNTKTLQNFLALENKVHQMIIILDNYLDSTEISAKINKKIQKLPNNKSKAEPWEVINETFYNTMTADKQGDTLIRFIIIIVVIIGVLNTVLMSLLERKREFGILLAIGTKPKQIFSIIMLEVFFLSLIAISIGSILSSFSVLYLSTIGITFPEPVIIAGIQLQHLKGAFLPQVYLTPIISIMVSSLVAALIPALKTAKTIPIKALRSN